MRFSVPSSCVRRSWKAALAFRFGIVLDRHQQPRQRRSHFALRLREFRERFGIVDEFGCRLDRRRLCAGLDHVLQRRLLEVRLALDRADDVRDQVGAPLVLAQHFGPRRFHRLVLLLDGVVAAAGQQAGQNDGKSPRNAFIKSSD